MNYYLHSSRIQQAYWHSSASMGLVIGVPGKLLPK